MYYIYQAFRILRFCYRKFIKLFDFTNYAKKDLDYLKQFIDVRHLKPATGELRERQNSILEFAKEIVKLLEENNITPILAYGNLIGAERHQGFIPWDDDIDFDLIREDYEKLIQLAKEKYVFIKRPANRFWSWNRTLEYEDNLFHKYPNQLIFVQSYNHLQLYRATDYRDMKLLDFFSLDYYSDDYEYFEHKLYLKQIVRKFYEINNYAKEVDFLNEEMKSNPNIVKDSNTIFYGIDSDPSYTNAINNGEWFTKDDLYPLKKMKFEDTEFWVPNNHIKFMEHRYGNWEGLPDNMEFSRHFPIVENYIKRKYGLKEVNNV